jgi:integrase
VRIGRLSARRAASVRPPKGRRQAQFPDGGNLYLQCTVGAGGEISRSWTFRYELRGRRHELGLGRLCDFGLAEARAKAKTLRQQLADGIDPLTEKRRVIAERARDVTFRQATDQYLALHSDSWRNAKHRLQWITTLERLAFPFIGDLPVAVVEPGHVHRVIETAWQRTPETAARLRQRIERVLDYATAAGLRSGANPAAAVAEAFPKRRKAVHMAAVPYAELPGLMARVREEAALAARALELCVLTATRTSEALFAVWDEFDLDNRLWTVAAARTKTHQQLRIPLSGPALALLRALPRNGERLFTLPHDAMLRVLQQLRPGATTHGMRAAFRTWCAEQTAFPHEVCEQALGHAISNAVERAYKRTDLFDRRRKLMEAWASYCSKPIAAGGVVVPIRGTADA